MSYIIQPTAFCCGPTALFNLLVWARCSNTFSLATLHELCQCKHDTEGGTDYIPFVQTIRFLEQHVTIKWTCFVLFPTLEYLVQHLQPQHIIILEFHFDSNGTRGEHYMLLTQFDAKTSLFTAINTVDSFDTQQLSQFISAKDMSILLQPFVNPKNAFLALEQQRVFPKAWCFEHIQ